MLVSLKRWSAAAVILVSIVIVLGAYTRLKDAGLGCPDWPGCYGNLLAPTADTKAWTEMIHRYVAGTLGILVLIITFKTLQAKTIRSDLWLLASFVLGLVVFQAALGMWTVTLRLYPLVVMGHLLGGFAILALLWLLYLRLKPSYLVPAVPLKIKILGICCLLLLTIQIALGSWTSANYAALVCADFPSCQGSLWPPMDWRTAFNLTAVGIFDSPGVALENTARVTIQMFHRLGAAITAITSCIFMWQIFQLAVKPLQRLAMMFIVLLIAQIILGISNVLARLPLAVSLAHNATAAALLILLITILYRLNDKSSSNQ